MTDDETWLVVTEGRPRHWGTRPAVLAPNPTVCPVCLTDNEISPCPADCLTRTEETQ